MKILSSGGGIASAWEQPVKALLIGIGKSTDGTWQTLAEVTSGKGVVSHIAGDAAGSPNEVRLTVDGNVVYQGRVRDVSTTTEYMDADFPIFGVDSGKAKEFPPIFFNDSMKLETNDATNETQYGVRVFA